MNKSIVLYLLLAGLFTCFSCTHTKQQPEEEGVDSEWLDSLQHVYQYGICIDSLDVTEYKMRNGDNPAAIFSALGFSALKADSITKASIHVLNPTKLRAGMNYYTFTTQDSVADIRYIAFAKSLVDYAVIDLTGDSILAYEFNKPITIKRHYTEGTINSSLWNVIKASGADPLLAIKISDVYAWQIDFFDVKEGDSFRVLYDCCLYRRHDSPEYHLHRGSRLQRIKEKILQPYHSPRIAFSNISILKGTASGRLS